MIVESSIKTTKGAKIIIDTLKQLGVDTVFGYPGGVVLDVYDELYKQSDIKHILVRHEQSAVHAAEGYSRVTGKCGVVLVTSGPGATNTVTGIVNAYLDGYPVVVLTGQVFSNLIGNDAFQEADICSITKSCTKATFQVKNADDIQSTLSKAFEIAVSGKKGPVVVDFVKDVFSEKVKIKDFNDICINNYEYNCSSNDLSRIYNKIISAKSPVLLIGGGVNNSDCYKDLDYFVKYLNLPVVSTMMGLGGFNTESENYFGMVGIFGANSANELLRKSDLIITLGARLNDRISCVFKNDDIYSKIIQIDINKDEISRFFIPIDSLISDAGAFLREINSMLSVRDKNKYLVWTNFAQGLKSSNKVYEKQSNMLYSFEIMQKLQDFTKNMNVVFTSEVGQHLLWAVKNLQFNNNRKILVSGGSGTMGFGLPASIGACVALKNKPVVCISGDGSFQMGIHELATCAENNLNIKIIILNNGYLGMVRQLQENFCDGRYSQTKITNPDFVKLAQSYGIGALRVSSFDEIDSAFKKAFSTDKTFILDFAVEPYEKL